MNELNLDFIVKKHHLDDTGLTRHYLTLYSIVLGMESKNVFEFGAGFSTRSMIEALKLTGGKLTSVDMRTVESRTTDFPPNFKNDNKDIWSFHNGNSLDVVPKLNHDKCYDVVLHDGSHTAADVTKDLDNIAPYVKSGGLVLIHDTTHHYLGLEMCYGVNNSKLVTDYKHDSSTLPYGYGLTIIRVLENPHNNERVEILWRKK